MKNMYEKKASTKTAKCPECGSKYLVATGYCVSCKKKVAEPVGAKKKDEKKETFTAKESFKIPGTGIIVEAGQKIEVVKEVVSEDYDRDVQTLTNTFRAAITTFYESDSGLSPVDMSEAIAEALHGALSDPKFQIVRQAMPNRIIDLF